MDDQVVKLIQEKSNSFAGMDRVSAFMYHKEIQNDFFLVKLEEGKRIVYPIQFWGREEYRLFLSPLSGNRLTISLARGDLITSINCFDLYLLCRNLVLSEETEVEDRKSKLRLRREEGVFILKIPAHRWRVKFSVIQDRHKAPDVSDLEREMIYKAPHGLDHQMRLASRRV